MAIFVSKVTLWNAWTTLEKLVVKIFSELMITLFSTFQLGVWVTLEGNGIQEKYTVVKIKDWGLAVEYSETSRELEQATCYIGRIIKKTAQHFKEKKIANDFCIIQMQSFFLLGSRFHRDKRWIASDRSMFNQKVMELKLKLK